MLQVRPKDIFSNAARSVSNKPDTTVSSRRKSQNPHNSKLEPLSNKAVSDYEQIAALVTKSTKASEKKGCHEVSRIRDALIAEKVDMYAPFGRMFKF